MSRTRRYPPLLAIVLVIFIALAVLPSALTLPQSSPSTTLEYAPVPPSDRQNAPPGGNLSSLGLASSGTLGVAINDGALPGAGAATGAQGVGKRPSAKRCVGKPPRQTEDLNSPPCVPYFDGDNGGATYKGVTADEVRVVFYASPACWAHTGRAYDCESARTGEYFDLGKPPEPDEPLTPRTYRRFQRHFNDRYQTYGRFVHFWIYFEAGEPAPEVRRADAADNLAKVNPFSVMLSDLYTGGENAYADYVAQHGVLNFGLLAQQSESFYGQYPGLIWGFFPSVEQQAKMFSSYVCRKVVGQPAVDSGNAGENGGPRRLGYVRTTDKSRPDLILFASLIRKQIEACGGTFVSEATFPYATRATNAFTGDPAVYAAQNMADFQEKKVTTVVWAGGLESDQSRAAARISYYPEWILAGDKFLEAGDNTLYQEQSEWRHAWVVTTVKRIPEPDDEPCRQALREVDTTDDGAATAFCAGAIFDDLRQLFTGVQVAGPRLTLRTIDQGYHAIPPKSSTDPQIPACFYLSRDFTCVKDSQAEHWDPNGVATAGAVQGCWRMLEGGKRYLAGDWPAGNINAQFRPDDPCNRYDNAAFL